MGIGILDYTHYCIWVYMGIGVPVCPESSLAPASNNFLFILWVWVLATQVKNSGVAPCPCNPGVGEDGAEKGGSPRLASWPVYKSGELQLYQETLFWENNEELQQRRKLNIQFSACKWTYRSSHACPQVRLHIPRWKVTTITNKEM